MCNKCNFLIRTLIPNSARSELHAINQQALLFARRARSIPVMPLLPRGALQKRKLKRIYSLRRGGRAVPRAGLLRPWGRRWQGKGGAGRGGPGEDWRAGRLLPEEQQEEAGKGEGSDSRGWVAPGSRSQQPQCHAPPWPFPQRQQKAAFRLAFQAGGRAATPGLAPKAAGSAEQSGRWALVNILFGKKSRVAFVSLDGDETTSLPLET